MNKPVVLGVAAGVLVLVGLGAVVGFGPSQPGSVGVAVSTGSSANVGTVPAAGDPGASPLAFPGERGEAGRMAGTSSSVEPGEGTLSVPRREAIASRPGLVDIQPGKPGAPGIDDIQADLKAMTAGGRQPSVAELDRVLGNLQQNQGSTVVAGVDLQVVRNNLQQAERIRLLSEEMKPLAQNPSPENTRRMQELMAEIQQAQANLRVDVMARRP